MSEAIIWYLFLYTLSPVFIYVIYWVWRVKNYALSELSQENSFFKAEIDKFRRFADKVEEIHVENNKAAMDLDDAPDEFRGIFILSMVTAQVWNVINTLPKSSTNSHGLICP